MTHNNLLRTLMGVLLTLAALFGLTACDGVAAPGELGENQQLLTTCPADLKINRIVHWDGTGSGRSPEIDEERLDIIEQLARETAVCGGHLTVTGYSSSSGATVTIYDGRLALPGATDNARLRRVPEAVETIMSEISSSYEQALASLPAGGSDISGMWRLAAEQQAQLGAGYQLRYVNLTDGLDNIGVALTPGLTPEQAIELADQVNVPDLTGAEVTIAGLGRVAGDPVSSSVAESLVAFYDRLCERTGAASCLAVTDWR
ncbi:hypothetical protein [Microbacterium sp.]|uniref:hypothetical protein n=1 Tax=Microbacterium sp. TaxID=51671 RepID=UPI0025E69503|nr:hypothetical protein [Microbacterium sp.]MBT9605917.1 hypothetical protein [Microbacterium sp.]